MAVAAKTETKKQKNMLWFHIIMMFLLIGGFSVMAPIGSITPLDCSGPAYWACWP